MKKIITILLILVFFIFSLPALAQIDFVEGYYIDESGNKVTGFIKDYGKATVPKTLVFKNETSDEQEKIKTASLKEFQIGGKNFKKFMVQIDKSPSQPPFPSTPNATYEVDTVFLQSLLLGKASLYKYYENDLTIYFLQIDDLQPLQLLKKYYQANDLEYNVINKYRQQLYNSLKCGNASQASFANLSYTQTSLIKVIKTFNKCQGGTSQLLTKKNTPWKYSLSVKAGIRPTNIVFTFPPSPLSGVSQDPVEYPDYTSPILGLEFETFLPISNNKWSFFFNPNYYNYSVEEEEQNQRPFTLSKNSSVLLSLGLRYHIYLLQGDLDFFLNANVAPRIFLENDLEFNQVTIPLNTQVFLPVLGAGLRFKDTFSVEYRRGNLGAVNNNTLLFDMDQKFHSFTLGYAFLRSKDSSDK